MGAMYQSYFGLKDNPFSISPDPRFLYMSERHREALAHLLYGLNTEGAFILLSGDVGTGKTTVSRCLMEQVPENTSIALVLNPRLSAVELLQTICDELRIQYPAHTSSVKLLVDYLNRYLLGAHAMGKKTVLLIEEAQNLDRDVLEQLRLLTNLETNEQKLLQIILLGQPELRELLDQPELSQLSQRITARYHLSPLSWTDMKRYVQHRLIVSGCSRPLFDTASLKYLYRVTGGVPRLVNVICDRALLGAYVQNHNQVNLKTMTQAASEVLSEYHLQPHRESPVWKKTAVAAILLLLLGVGSYGVYDLKFKSVPESPLQEIVTAVDEQLSQPVRALTANESAKPASIIQWPDELVRMRSNSLAYQSLFRLWKLQYQPESNGSACFFAQQKGLGCYHGMGNLLQLEQYNRPVVLELETPDENIVFATLKQMGNTQASLDIAGETVQVSRDYLMQVWNGKFTLVWKQPPEFEDNIHPGYRGGAIKWLASVLNKIDASQSIETGDVYDAELQDKVIAFQKQEGLVPDGIVGIRTAIHLNDRIDTNMPKLIKSS